MKRLTAVVLFFLAFGAAPVFTHGGNEHVRGTVTAITPQSITVQTTAKATRTLTLNAKTTYKQGTKTAQFGDVKVGDRVVIDVPEKKTEALLIQIGTSPAAPATAKK